MIGPKTGNSFATSKSTTVDAFGRSDCAEGVGENWPNCDACVETFCTRDLWSSVVVGSASAPGVESSLILWVGLTAGEDGTCCGTTTSSFNWLGDMPGRPGVVSRSLVSAMLDVSGKGICNDNPGRQVAEQRWLVYSHYQWPCGRPYVSLYHIHVVQH